MHVLHVCVTAAHMWSRHFRLSAYVGLVMQYIYRLSADHMTPVRSVYSSHICCYKVLFVSTQHTVCREL